MSKALVNFHSSVPLDEIALLKIHRKSRYSSAAHTLEGKLKHPHNKKSKYCHACHTSPVLTIILTDNMSILGLVEPDAAHGVVNVAILNSQS